MQLFPALLTQIPQQTMLLHIQIKVGQLWIVSFSIMWPVDGQNESVHKIDKNFPRPEKCLSHCSMWITSFPWKCGQATSVGHILLVDSECCHGNIK